MKAPVSRRAVIARAKRSLDKDGYFLSVQRAESAIREYGRYWVMDASTNFYVESYPSVADLAEGLGILKAWEQLEDDSEAE